jgi:hypothetical protein
MPDRYLEPYHISSYSWVVAISYIYNRRLLDGNTDSEGGASKKPRKRSPPVSKPKTSTAPQKSPAKKGSIAVTSSSTSALSPSPKNHASQLITPNVPVPFTPIRLAPSPYLGLTATSQGGIWPQHDPQPRPNSFGTASPSTPGKAGGVGSALASILDVDSDSNRVPWVASLANLDPESKLATDIKELGLDPASLFPPIIFDIRIYGNLGAWERAPIARQRMVRLAEELVHSQNTTPNHTPAPPPRSDSPREVVSLARPERAGLYANLDRIRKRFKEEMSDIIIHQI